MRIRRRSSLALAAVAFAAAPPAHAHLVETGFGAFYNGVAHLALTPADLLVVVAMALFAGQRGPEAVRRVLFALPLAWLAGGLAGAHWSTSSNTGSIMGSTPVVFTTLSSALVGALVLLDARIRPPAVALLALAAGLLHGYVNGATMAPGGADRLTLAGAVAAIFCVLALVAAEVTSLSAGWQRTAVRVGGSWIAAAGILMLGWLARPMV